MSHSLPSISLTRARNIALAAQGFGKKPPQKVTHAHLKRNVENLGLYQIDSVNVICRAHYFPAFSRLGHYDQQLLHDLAWGQPKHRHLFEYWGHEASLLPVEIFPLFRWRMQRADQGISGYKAMRIISQEYRPKAFELLKIIADQGPMRASDFEKGQTGWWQWSETKTMLEWLFFAGHLSTATRGNNFERLYDLTERVIPTEILSRPEINAFEAQKQLLTHAAKALGIATEKDLRDYFRLDTTETRQILPQLVEEGILQQVKVADWPTTYLYHQAKAPSRIEGATLLAPFDPLIWERSRTSRLFNFNYTIEIYVPKHKRVYGYYVLPLLYNGQLVGRVDVKADRRNKQLLVHALHYQSDCPAETPEVFQDSLQNLASWLGLETIKYPS